jgi:hypothetical protein
MLYYGGEKRVINAAMEPIFLHSTLFVISRSGVRVRSPAPNWAVRPEDEAGQALYKIS